MGVSASPYTAILFLVLATVGLRFKVGVSCSSWLFFVLVIVYLGGIMVIFVYLRRLIQSMKVNLVGGQISLLLFFIPALASLSWFVKITPITMGL